MQHTYVVSCLARTKNLEWPQIIVKLILMKVNWKCVICAHSRRSKTKHSFTTLRWNTKRKQDLTVLAVIVNSTLNIRWKDISKVRFKLDQNLTLFGTGFDRKKKCPCLAPSRVEATFTSLLTGWQSNPIANMESLMKIQRKESNFKITRDKKYLTLCQITLKDIEYDFKMDLESLLVVSLQTIWFMCQIVYGVRWKQICLCT